jgi:hypothetical protein
LLCTSPGSIRIRDHLLSFARRCIFAQKKYEVRSAIAKVSQGIFRAVAFSFPGGYIDIRIPAIGALS